MGKECVVGQNPWAVLVVLLQAMCERGLLHLLDFGGNQLDLRWLEPKWLRVHVCMYACMHAYRMCELASTV